jgi:16S rRNA (cytidine1402-2'-O)-methyltransferase
MLYIVAGPIGNLGDITLRALEVLRGAEVVLVEDTRKAGTFFKSLNIPKKNLLSFYEHNEDKRIPQIISYLKDNKTVVLLSGAGTPLVSDPGFRLLRRCREEKIEFTSLPGPCAAINALVLSGCASDSFLFLGFLPKKKGKRIKRIESIKNLSSSIILFESPYRLTKTLKDLEQILGNRRCALCREMTKIYEETLRGRILEVIEEISPRKIKGECCLVIEGKKESQAPQ